MIMNSRFNIWSSILVYTSSSIFSKRLNDQLLSQFFFDYTIIILLCQVALMFLVLELGRSFHFMDIPPYTLQRGKRFFIPSILYFAFCYVSTGLLNDFDTTLFNTLVRTFPLVTILLSSTILEHRPNRNQGVLFSVILITFGSVLTGLSEISFSVTSLCYGFGIVMLQAMSLVLIDRTITNSQDSTWEMLYAFAFNGLLFFILLDLIFYESQDAFTYVITSTTPSFWITFCLLLVIGIIFHWSVFYVMAHNSAVTVSIISNIMGILSFIIAPELFGINMKFGVWNWIGFFICILGCMLYIFFISVRR